MLNLCKDLVGIVYVSYIVKEVDLWFCVEDYCYVMYKFNVIIDLLMKFLNCMVDLLVYEL